MALLSVRFAVGASDGSIQRFFDVQNPIDVQHDQQPIVQIDEPRQIVVTEPDNAWGRRHDAVGRNSHHFVDSIDDQTDGLSGDRHDHDPSLFGRLGFQHAETQTQIDDRDHRVPQIDQSLDERRALGDPRDLAQQNDLLDPRDLDAVFLFGQAKACLLYTSPSPRD